MDEEQVSCLFAYSYDNNLPQALNQLTNQVAHCVTETSHIIHEGRGYFHFKKKII